jgi:hypothetical protein
MLVGVVSDVGPKETARSVTPRCQAPAWGIAEDAAGGWSGRGDKEKAAVCLIRYGKCPPFHYFSLFFHEKDMKDTFNLHTTYHISASPRLCVRYFGIFSPNGELPDAGSKPLTTFSFNAILERINKGVY